MKETILFACTLDCPDACPLLITREDGQIGKIRGNPNHPYTDGYCCAKTQGFPSRLNSPSRVKKPTLREGKAWREITCMEAISLRTEKIQKYRREPGSILHLRGGTAKGVSNLAEVVFFAKLGTTRSYPRSTNP